MGLGETPILEIWRAKAYVDPNFSMGQVKIARILLLGIGTKL